MFSSNSYDSAAQVLVKLGRENTQVPITVEKGDVYSTGVQKEEIHSYMRLMTSNEIIMQTIGELGLQRFEYKPGEAKSFFQTIKFALKGVARWGKARLNDVIIMLGLRTRLSEKEQVFKLLKRNLKVVREKDSNVISLFIRLPDPVLAKDVISKVLEIYEKSHIELNQQSNMVTVFDGLTESDKLELEKKEKEIERVKQEWSLSSPDLQIQTLIQNIQSLKLKRDLQIVQKDELLKEASKLRSQIVSLPKSQVTAKLIENNPSAVLIKEELTKLQVEEARMLKTYKKDSEMVRFISQRVEGLQTLLDQETNVDAIQSSSGVESNPFYEELFKEIKKIEVDIAGLNASVPKLEQSIDSIESEIEELNQGQIKLGVLQREYSVLEAKYLANAARFQRVKTDRALDDNNIANISILSRPIVAAEPAAPKKLLLMVIGIILALMASIGITLFREWLTQKIYDENDILDMGNMTFLGSYTLPK